MTRITWIAIGLLWLAQGCAGGPGERRPAGGGPIRIGLSLGTLKEERWQRDRELFAGKARDLGAEVTVRAANGDHAAQAQQAAELLAQGIDVLVVVPHDGEAAAAIVDAAQRQKVPVISYDRLIRYSDVALYVSFDNVMVGELQARYLLERAPRGNYILIGGALTDNNAKLLREGQMNVLRPAIERGDVRIIADQWAREWLPGEAYQQVTKALAENGREVVAVVASNDATAGGAIQALEEHALAGKVLVSGQDADLAALRRIIDGTQSMTVYKPLQPLAEQAAAAAIRLARGEGIVTGAVINNGKKDVPAMLLQPMAVDRQNIEATVIRDGFHRPEAIYGQKKEGAGPKVNGN